VIKKPESQWRDHERPCLVTAGIGAAVLVAFVTVQSVITHLAVQGVIALWS
jgi:hypothetical protein